MKIIIPSLPIPILTYIAQCIESVTDTNEDIELLVWNINQKSILDMFDETQPDIVFLHPSQLNSSFNIICKDFSFKYVLITGEDVSVSLPQSPNAIINLSRSNTIDKQYKNVIYTQPMTNIPNIYNAQHSDRLQSTIVIDSSFATLNNDIMGLLTYVASAYPTKIIGQQPIPLHQYLGKVDMINRANLFKSAKIVIDIGTVGDCWDAAYFQVPALSIYPSNSTIFHCVNLALLKLHIDSLLNNDLVRKKYIPETYKEACNNTSFHFSSNLFKTINEPRLAKILLDTLETLI